MKSENKYIGDDKFKKFLEHYHCSAPLEVVKFRFAGAICSPNTGLRPTDVISSFWPDGQTPRLETKNEAELFFKFFMGLWDEMFQKIRDNNLKLSKISTSADLESICRQRFETVELGFVEGFFGGEENLKIPAYIAEIVDSLSKMALLYKSLAEKSETRSNHKNIFDAVIDCDRMTEKSLNFIIENYVLPHISDLQRTVN